MVLLEEIFDDVATSTSPMVSLPSKLLSTTASSCDESKTKPLVVDSTEAEVGVEVDGRLEPPEEESQPLTTFTCFRQLPSELRVRIWKFSHPEPRILQVQQVPGAGGHYNKAFWDFGWDFVIRKTFLQPAALHTCKESRIEVLKSYGLIFGNDLPHEVYFNSNKDTLEFYPYAMCAMEAMHLRSPSNDFSAIKFIRIHWGATPAFHSRTPPNLEDSTLVQRLLYFVNLEEIDLIISWVDNGNSEPDLEQMVDARDDGKLRDAVVQVFRRQRAGDEAFDGVGDVVVTFKCEQVDWKDSLATCVSAH